MYQSVLIEDTVLVHPTKFNLDLDEAIKDSLDEKFEGKIDNDFGVALAVIDILEVGEGNIIAGDPSVHYPVKFRLLAWMPHQQELVEGTVVELTEWGAFIRVGPVDGLVHISQVMDDFVSYDEKNAQLTGKSSHKVLKVGDDVRARIISVSLKEQNKVGLTMRQPFLGRLDWDVKEVDDKPVVTKKRGKKGKKD